ncbi:MAG: extracellular solute-binding protein [Thermomicrobiales bacterium]|nr:extracellular solute-binding protein [Thermomicrobiales bacterium]
MADKVQGLNRRQLLKAGGAVGAAAAGAVLLPAHLQAAPRPAFSLRSNPQEITGGDIEVGVFYEEGPWFDHCKSIGDSLEADFPGTKVKYTFCNTASDAARALRWQNGDPLDVDTGRWNNMASTTWDWPNNGFVLDMTEAVGQPLADGTVWKDTFLPSVSSFVVDSRADTTTPGSYFGVPFELVLMLMQYNQTHFETAGITAPPTTWDEFLAACEALAAKGIKPICVSGPTAPYCAQWWDRLTQRIVGTEAVLAVAFGEAKAADNPGFLTAAQELAKFKANEWFMEGYDGADFTTAQALFFQGQAAMIHMGSWLSTEMKDVIPADFRLGVFDFPQYTGGAGDQDAGFGTAQVWSIANPEKATSHDVNVPLSIEYLKRWTSKERAAERSESLKMIPPIVDVPVPSGITGLEEAIARSANSPLNVYYYGIHWDTNLSTAWWNPVQALFLGQIGPEDMIKQLDEGLDQYRERKAAGA